MFTSGLTVFSVEAEHVLSCLPAKGWTLDNNHGASLPKSLSALSILPSPAFGTLPYGTEGSSPEGSDV